MSEIRIAMLLLMMLVGDEVHRESVSGWAGFRLGVLIVPCTAIQIWSTRLETLRVATAQAPRSSQMVQNRRILVQTDPPTRGSGEQNPT